MSFNSPFTEDLEAVDSANYKDFPEFEKVSRTIDNTLQNINSRHVVSIRNILSQYEKLLKSGEGYQSKGPEISRKFSQATSACTELFKQVDQQTKQLNDILNQSINDHEDEDAVRYLKQKEAITLDLVKNSLQSFQKCQKKYSSLEKLFREKIAGSVPTTEGTVTSNEGSNGAEQQQIQITYEPVNAEELEQQSLLVAEREREIQSISQDTQEINEIFSNLQDIIQEQQFQIDSIEDNILNYSSNVHDASRELTRAERYQRRSSGRMLCCLLILVGVFGSVILIGLIL